MDDYIIKGETLTAIADAIRGKTGGADGLDPVDMPDEINSIKTGGSAVPAKDVNFRDYDGTILHSYTAEEALALTELPKLPTQPGLICQEWNWSLEDMQSYVAEYGVCEVGATYITDDGKTRLYIHLEEGRTSPILGVCPNGTVTVDWGDGTEPDVLTGTSTYTETWTSNHVYAEAGDYVISLTVDGEMAFIYGSNSESKTPRLLAYSTTNDGRNDAYKNSVRKIEIGSGVTDITGYSLCYFTSLLSITIPSSIVTIGLNTFSMCCSLKYVVIPKSVTSIRKYSFNHCSSLLGVSLPANITIIEENVFYNCFSLPSVVIPKSVTSIKNYVFYCCYALNYVVIPKSVTSIGDSIFRSCSALVSVVIPATVSSIGSSLFYDCSGMAIYDFTNHTSVPVLAGTNAFKGIPSDCEIRVPAALAEEWKSATNWSTYADYIVGV